MAVQDAPVTVSRRPARALGTPAATVIAVVTTLLGLVVLAWAVLFVTKGRFLKGPFESIASSSAGRPVRVGGDFQFYFAPVDLRFRAERLTVDNPAWAGPRKFFEARLIDTRIATFASLLGKRRINALLLDGARIDTEWDATRVRNTWTFGDPDAKGKPFEMPVIRAAQVSGTALRYRDPQMRIAVDLTFQTVRAQDTRFASAVRFGGTGVARGTPFRLSGALLSPNATLAGGENRLQLHIEGARTVADVGGTLAGATELEGAKLQVDVRGRNLADLFSLGGIVVPETRRYRLRSALTKIGDEYRFTKMVGTFGDSDIGGWMTVAMHEPRLLVTADVVTRKLDIVDVAPFIGYNPDDVAARGASGAITTVGGTPRLLPDAPLRTDELGNFDAQVKYRVRAVRSRRIPVSDIALTLKLDDRLLTLSPLTFDMSGGHVASDVSINARRTPVFTDYDIRLAPTPLGRLFKGWGLEESGTTGTIRGRVKMTGSGNSVASSLASSNGRIAVVLPRGTFWTRNIQLAELDLGTFLQKLLQDKLKKPVEINCGLIGFTVRDGIAAADPIIVDTDKNVILGRGGFSFRNEALDLSVRGDGKKFSLFSGQSPIGVNGYFAAPGIAPISPELVGRAGAGIGLALVASPLAAVLAFVDVGDAKATDCGPVLAGARANAQRTDKGRPRDDVGTGKPGVEVKKDKKILGIL